MGSNNKISQQIQKSTRDNTIHGSDFIEDGPLKDLFIQFVDIIFEVQELRKRISVLEKSGLPPKSSRQPRKQKVLQTRVPIVKFNEIRKLHGTNISSVIRKFINVHEHDSTWRPNKLSSEGKKGIKISCSISVDEAKKIESWCAILGKDWNKSELMRALLFSPIPDLAQESPSQRAVRQIIANTPQSILEKYLDFAKRKKG